MKPWVVRWSICAAVLLLVFGTGGLLVAVSGVVPIKASAGHFAVTASFLQFAKERSVKTHTLTMPAPPLDEPWLVLKGAGHYETGCRPCHGSPEYRAPLIAQGMLPPPPYLAGPRMDIWDPEELFYIVKHGIKMTGMPAWPALHRDDEVHAMVAFLLQLPKLNAESYRRLVHGDTGSSAPREPLEDMIEPAPPVIATSCARCHGVRGEGRGNAAFPKLAGQRREYLEAAMEAYAKGRRHSGIMQPLAAPLEPDAWRDIADYYSRRGSMRPSVSGKDAQAIERGRQLAEKGSRGQGIPPCNKCHGPSTEPKNPHYPLLAGQYADYLSLQLELFKTQARGGSEYAHLMYNVASRMRPEQMRDVALYYGSLAAP